MATYSRRPFSRTDVGEGFYRTLLIVCLFFITFLVYGSYHSFGVFLKPLAQEFNVTRSVVSGAISVAWIAHGIFAVVAGIVSDRRGPRPVMLAAIALISLGYGLMMTSSSLWQLYLYVGVILGTGMAPIWIVASAITTQWFSRRRGLSLGIVLAGPGMGQIVVTPIVRYLIDAYDFRIAYLIVGLAVFVIGIPLATVLRPAPREENSLERLASLPESTPERSFGIRKAMATGVFWLLFAIWLLVPWAIQLFRVHVFPYASDKGIEEAAASLIFVFLGAGIVAGRIGWGAFADRFGAKRVYALLLILLAAALGITAVLEQLWAFYAMATFFGFTMGGNDPVFVKLLTDFFGVRYAGSLLGILNSAFTVSAAAGPFVGGLVFDYAGSYSLGFLLAALSALGAVLLSLFLASPQRRASTE